MQTDHGEFLKCRNWPTDANFKIVAYRPGERACEAIEVEEMAIDILYAVEALSASGVLGELEPEWFARLKLYFVVVKKLACVQKALISIQSGRLREFGVRLGFTSPAD